MAAWSLPKQSLRLLTVAMLSGLRWQPNGSVGSIGIVATWSFACLSVFKSLEGGKTVWVAMTTNW